MKKVSQFLREYMSVFIVLIALLGVRTFVADWNYIPSESMEPNIYEGDYVLAKKSFGPSLFWFNDKLWSSGSPERGDIITFIPPHVDVIFIKRVLAVPGDVVTIQNERIAVNGKWLTQTPEDAADYLFSKENNNGVEYKTQITKKDPVLPHSEQITVPEGKLFVLGDHRNHSADSRAWGFVDNDKVLGKVTHLFFSFSDKRSFMDSLFMKI